MGSSSAIFFCSTSCANESKVNRVVARTSSTPWTQRGMGLKARLHAARDGDALD
jgi:hypothetical protein